tara:strand:- start:5560 stop:5907 length:348 start_codon:yes stop_codon:yes gene_type:complete
MVNPQFIEESPLGIVQIKSMLKSMEKRDIDMNYRSNKAKEFIDFFGSALGAAKSEDLMKKLSSLSITRLKPVHIIKIIDFLPRDLDELRIIMTSYTVSLPKKDQEAIVAAVKEFL